MCSIVWACVDIYFFEKEKGIYTYILYTIKHIRAIISFLLNPLAQICARLLDLFSLKKNMFRIMRRNISRRIISFYVCGIEFQHPVWKKKLAGGICSYKERFLVISRAITIDFFFYLVNENNIVKYLWIVFKIHI